MDGPVFDAMLKTALEEALRRDIEETAAPPPPSRRQRRRMRGLLADFRRGPFSDRKRRPRNPARYLAAAVIAALLTGVAAAGLALGGGLLRPRCPEVPVQPSGRRPHLHPLRHAGGPFPA